MKWDEIAALSEFSNIGIPKGTLHSIYKGVRDVPKEYRRALGEADIVEVPACSACGKAHNIDRACELELSIRQPRKPKEYKRPGWLWDMPVNELRSALQNRTEVER